MHTSVVRIELRSIHTTLEKCENAAIFVRVGLSSTCTNPSKKMKFFENALQTRGAQKCWLYVQHKSKMTGNCFSGVVWIGSIGCVSTLRRSVDAAFSKRFNWIDLSDRLIIIHLLFISSFIHSFIYSFINLISLIG